MGVQGLTTFIENNSKIFRDIHFRNSKLIIDGCNLYHLLYFNTGLEQNHGGEYDAFDDLITKFVKALRDCGIEPYVVLDGGADCSDIKYDTLMKRAEDRIRRAQSAAMGGKGNILPPLVKLVLKQTLTNLKVPFAQCYGEADSQIASLAREWRCPVLSNDSDFYVLDLPGGFLPTSHFKWDDTVSQNGRQRYIPCKYYTTSCFCVYFNIKLQLLPLMAALAGNDYVKLREMGLSIPWSVYSREGSRFDGIVRWLKDFQSPDDALKAVLGLMDGLSRQREAEVLQALTLGMKEYQFPTTCLPRFFNDGSALDLEPEAVGIVPDWARLPLTQGRLTSDILDVLLLRRLMQSFQVDHAHLPSANITSLPIRQVMYGLLLGCKARTRVEEWDRRGTQLSKIMIHPIVCGVAQQLTLDVLHQAEQSVLERAFLEPLGVSLNTLKGVPPNLRLPVAVTCYWLQHSSPRPDEKVIQALLLGMVAGESNRQRDVTGEMQMDIPVQPEQDFNVTHAFNQWQVCFKDSIHLNQLLCFPLREPQIAWLYKGKLVHYLVHRLRKGSDPELLLQKETSRQLYKALLTAVLQSQDVVSNSPTSRRGAAPKQHQPADDLAALLDALQLLEEDLEKDGSRGDTVTLEEYPDWDSVSVKTRYKAKDQWSKAKDQWSKSKEQWSKNRELTRKQGRIDRDFSMRC